MLLDGTHLVTEAVAAGIALQHVLVAADARDERRSIAAAARPARCAQRRRRRGSVARR